MEPLTEVQKRVFEFIKRFIEQYGYAPNYEEMRIGLGYATKSAVAYQVVSLERAGYIRRSPRKARAIWVNTEALRTHEITEMRTLTGGSHVED